MATDCSSLYLQSRQVRLRRPLAVQVAFFSTFHEPKSWGSLSSTCSSLRPQTLHLRVRLPLAVQVGSFVTFHLPHS